jgi:hypothetical protein
LAETIDQPISAGDDCIVLPHIDIGRREPPPFLPKQTVDLDVLKLPGSRYLPRASGLATPGIADDDDAWHGPSVRSVQRLSTSVLIPTKRARVERQLRGISTRSRRRG